MLFRSRSMPDAPRYRRVRLKISGEALMGGRDYGIDPDRVNRVAGEIAQIHALGTEVCLVVGAGNIFRGIIGAAQGIERATADYMGMLATGIHAIALQRRCEMERLHTRAMSDILMETVCEPHIGRRPGRQRETGAGGHLP